MRQNATMQRFFAWDCVEHFETKFDDSALRDFLAFRHAALPNDDP
jgi:hypothetical protein